ncbi:MAG: hypothetical protein AAF431_12990 [Pseudomonadota bacterium]
MRRIPLNIAKLYWAWLAIFFLWVNGGLLLTELAGPLRGTIIVSWADYAWMLVFQAVGAGFAVLSFPDRKIEKFDLRDNVLSGPNSTSVNFTMDSVNLSKPFKFNKSRVFYPFSTVYLKQDQHTVCLSTMFLSKSEMAEITGSINNITDSEPDK